MPIEIIGSPDTDRFWVEVDKKGGTWGYTLRTKSDVFAMGRGAEVARLNSYYVAMQGGDTYARELLALLNRTPE